MTVYTVSNGAVVAGADALDDGIHRELLGMGNWSRIYRASVRVEVRPRPQART